MKTLSAPRRRAQASTTDGPPTYSIRMSQPLLSLKVTVACSSFCRLSLTSRWRYLSRRGLCVSGWSCPARTGIRAVSGVCSCCIFSSTATASGNLMTLSSGKGVSMWTPAQRPSSVSRATPARAFLSRIRAWMSRSKERASTAACGVAGNPSAARRGRAGESRARESKRAGKMRDMESSQGCSVLWRCPGRRTGHERIFRQDRDCPRSGQEEM